jgi:hypothetical protein
VPFVALKKNRSENTLNDISAFISNTEPRQN